MNQDSGYGPLAWVILFALAAIWGSSFILMKFGLEHLTPFQIACVRLSTAGLCLSPFLFKYAKKVNRKDLLVLFLSGLTGNGIPAFLFPQAEEVIPSAVAGLLNSLSPLFILIMAVVFWKAKFGPAKVAGVFIGMAGAIIMLLAGATDMHFDFSQHFSFSLLVVLATVCYAISSNLIKYTLAHYPPLLITTFSLGFMALMALPSLFLFSDFSATLRQPGVWDSLGAIVILGAVGTALAVSIFVRLLHWTDPIFAGSVTYVMPIVALAIGLWFAEPIHWMHFLGFLVVITGVYLVNRKR